MVSMHYLRRLYLVSQYFEHLASPNEGVCAEHRQVDLIAVVPYHEQSHSEASVHTLSTSSAGSMNIDLHNALFKRGDTCYPEIICRALHAANNYIFSNFGEQLQIMVNHVQISFIIFHFQIMVRW